MPSRAIPDRLRGRDITWPRPTADWPAASRLLAPVAGISVHASGRFPLGRRPPGRLRPSGVGPCRRCPRLGPPRLRTRHNRPRPAGSRPPPSIAHRPPGDLHIGSVRPGIPVPGNSQPTLPLSVEFRQGSRPWEIPLRAPAPRGLVLFRFAEEHSPAETGGWRGPGARAAARLAPVTPLASRSRPGCLGLASAERERKPLSWRPERTPDPGRVWPGPPGGGYGPCGSAERSAPRSRWRVRGSPRGPLRGLFLASQTPTPVRAPEIRGGIEEVLLREVAGEESSRDFDGLPHTRSTAQAPPTPVMARAAERSRLRFDLRSFERGAACQGVSVRESALVCLDKEWPDSGSRGGRALLTLAVGAQGCPPRPISSADPSAAVCPWSEGSAEDFQAVSSDVSWYPCVTPARLAGFRAPDRSGSKDRGERGSMSRGPLVPASSVP